LQPVLADVLDELAWILATHPSADLFAKAINAVEMARALALAAGQNEMAARNVELLKLCR